MDIKKHLEILRTAYKNRKNIAWNDFASPRGYRDFPEAYLLPFPFPRGSVRANIWQKALSEELGCRVTYPAMVRILNSFVVAAA